MPDAFNTVFRNERFFGSDGEFITRQFREGATFTHNDHLLYHVLARLLVRAAPWIPGLDPDAVAVHKALSAAGGAGGVALLFVFGHRFSGSLPAALALALLCGGAASWWFFSATVDTYLPSVCASVLALGLALECARSQKLTRYLGLGAAMGLAALLRTDGVLLAPLPLVAALHRGTPGDRLRRAAAALGSAALVGGLGYALLACHFYGVAPADVPAFALSHQERQRVVKGKWARPENLAPRRIRWVLANHFVYGVILPELTRTRDERVLSKMASHPHGLFSLGVLAAFGGWMVAGLLRLGRAARRERDPTPLLLMGIALLWLAMRVLFYAWWDPFDPFLFAVTSLPALWLLALLFVTGAGAEARRARVAGAALLAVVVWAHNAATLIAPLQDKIREPLSHRSAGAPGPSAPP